MKRHAAHGLALVASIVLNATFGCSSASSSSSRSGVDESAELPTISDDDRGKLCDWIAAQIGGYGHAANAICDGGIPVRATYVDDRATCIAKLASKPNCAATVSEIEDCITAEIAAGPCVLSEGAPAACTPLESDVCSGL